MNFLQNIYEEKTYYICEQRWGAFERTTMLPINVATKKVTTNFEDDILIIGLPKAEKVRPKAITVKAK